MSTSLGELSASPAISVILPVLNEEPHLEESVLAILSQDYHGRFEVILALGPSQDRTNEIASSLAARDHRVKLVTNPTGKTAAGLNLAIASSKSSVIVRVDGHAKIPSNYLSLAIEILQETGAVNVGGVMAAEGISKFEKAVARAMRSPLGVGASRFHTGGSAGEVDTVYLGAFRREAIIAAGGFDERYTRAQDWELNYRLRQNGGAIYFDPRLHVTYRPRPNLVKLAKQYFQYGKWRRVVSRSHSGTINLRYLAPPSALVGTLISVISGLLINPILYLPAVVYAGFVLLSSLLIAKSVSEYFSLLAIIPTMHFAWGAGFITSTKTLR
ncbi:MAG: glycosyltransferase family 2 protein [Candidatus Planktophila sp.]|nr:glycosyltransferase family 2 protein [Candidatus Planktophila sp.]